MRKFSLLVVVALSGCAVSSSERPEAPEIDVDPKLSPRVTHGSVDGTGHPGVVLLRMYTADSGPDGAWRCSGTLLSPTIVITAGHCTDEPGIVTGIKVFNQPEVPSYNSPSAVAKRWSSHPQYTNAAFFIHDVGMVELETPIELAAGDYGQLPGQDSLDVLKSTGKAATFTAVGYGLQRINGKMANNLSADRTRMFATPKLVQINTGFTGSFSLLLSNNASTGGTCFGDSGGPNFVESSMTIGGVTSFGLNHSCGGTGGVFRLDRADVLDYVADFIAGN